MVLGPDLGHEAPVGDGEDVLPAIELFSSGLKMRKFRLEVQLHHVAQEGPHPRGLGLHRPGAVTLTA
jgi:hypothetical protein